MKTEKEIEKRAIEDAMCHCFAGLEDKNPAKLYEELVVIVSLGLVNFQMMFKRGNHLTICR